MRYKRLKTTGLVNWQFCKRTYVIRIHLLPSIVGQKNLLISKLCPIDRKVALTTLSLAWKHFVLATPINILL